MNGIVGLVAFGVLCAGFLALCFAVMFWGRSVECKLGLSDWRSRAARRAADEANNLLRISWGVERKLEARIRELELRIDDLEGEVADHRAFLNFIEDYTIEADVAGSRALLSGCDCCNPELD
jgi:hypothetical protein